MVDRRRVSQSLDNDSNRMDDSANGAREPPRNADTLRRKLKRAAITLGAVVGLGLIGISSIYKVDQTQHAVITTFGNPSRVIVDPQIAHDVRLDTQKLREEYAKEKVSLAEGAGLRLKLPWQTVTKIDKRIQRWDGYPEEIATKDKKYLWIDTTARFYIEDPLKYVKTVGTELTANAKLSDILDAEVRNAITRYDLIEIVRTDNRKMAITEKELLNTVDVDSIVKGRPKVLQEISESSRTGCQGYGIRIHDVGVLIKGLRYVDSVKSAVEGRMIAERNRIASKYISEGDAAYEETMGKKNKELKTVTSEGYKTAGGIYGLADGTVIDIYANGFTEVVTNAQTSMVTTNVALGLNTDPDFYAFMRTMELYQSGIAGPNKVNYTIGSDNALIGTKNPFAASEVSTNSTTKIIGR